MSSLLGAPLFLLLLLSQGARPGSAVGAQSEMLKASRNAPKTRNDGVAEETVYVLGDGFLQSPRFPLGYPRGLALQWRLLAKAGARIQLGFDERFGLEEPEHSVCKYDYVEVEDVADGASSVRGRWCGAKAPSGKQISKSNQLLVRFRSDEYFPAKPGFRLYYSSVDMEMSGGTGLAVGTLHRGPISTGTASGSATGAMLPIGTAPLTGVRGAALPPDAGAAAVATGTLAARGSVLAVHHAGQTQLGAGSPLAAAASAPSGGGAVGTGAQQRVADKTAETPAGTGSHPQQTLGARIPVGMLSGGTGGTVLPQRAVDRLEEATGVTGTQSHHQRTPTHGARVPVGTHAGGTVGTGAHRAVDKPEDATGGAGGHSHHQGSRVPVGTHLGGTVAVGSHRHVEKSAEAPTGSTAVQAHGARLPVGTHSAWSTAAGSHRVADKPEDALGSVGPQSMRQRLVVGTHAAGTHAAIDKAAVAEVPPESTGAQPHHSTYTYRARHPAGTHASGVSGGVSGGVGSESEKSAGTGAGMPVHGMARLPVATLASGTQHRVADRPAEGTPGTHGGDGQHIAAGARQPGGGAGLQNVSKHLADAHAQKHAHEHGKLGAGSSVAGGDKHTAEAAKHPMSTLEVEKPHLGSKQHGADAALAVGTRAKELAVSASTHQDGGEQQQHQQQYQHHHKSHQSQQQQPQTALSRVPVGTSPSAETHVPGRRGHGVPGHQAEALPAATRVLPGHARRGRRRGLGGARGTGDPGPAAGELRMEVLSHTLSAFETLEDMVKFLEPESWQVELDRLAFSVPQARGRSSAHGRRWNGELNLNRLREEVRLYSCTPRNHSVSLREELGRTDTVFWPSCVLVRRCGGNCACCAHNCTQCRCKATRTARKVHEVLQIKAWRGSFHKNLTDVHLEHHEACQCTCANGVNG
uniref:Platelet-derived growth factor C n=1 Tax=Petromyzon marinus TaxID=7757 RepID=A0AAJ7WWH2_PETMA|nr:LOW QUALITY PROTEIN: platelet-derived growth factor C [Petromyzon marinus]